MNVRYGVILQVPLLGKLLNHYVNMKPETSLQPQEVKLRNVCNKFCSSIVCSLFENSEIFTKIYEKERSIKEVLGEILHWSLQKDREALESGKLPTKLYKRATKSLARSSWNLMIYSFLTCKVSSFITKVNDLWFDKTTHSSVSFPFQLYHNLS